MSERHSTAQPVRSKPSKPYPTYPLYAHAAGVWAKKIRGKVHYFGKWEDTDGALRKYLEQKDALHSGRTPKPDHDAATVKDCVNQFLNQKQTLVSVGELSPRTWTDYKDACDLVVAAFGKKRLLCDLATEDFTGLRDKLARRYGPHRLGKTIQCVRCLLKHAYEAGLIATPMRFGPGFKRPSKKTLRLHKAEQGPKLFTREEIRRLLDIASTPIKSMILLGVNCGYGNADCGRLPLSALDLGKGWVDYPRPKTGIPRRCPLWPETIVAIKEALACRPEPKAEEHNGLVFVTKYGHSWTSVSAVTQEFKKLLKILDSNGHRNFYTLRHTFRTVADASKDQPACDAIMGHESPHMSSLYRETISDERLRAVADYVRNWLFDVPASAGNIPPIAPIPFAASSDKEARHG